MPLERERPLWEVTLVGGLAGERSAVLQPVHHTVTDGVGGMTLLGLLFDPDPPRDEPGAAAGDQPAGDDRSAATPVVDTLATSLAALRPLGLVAGAGRALARRPAALPDHAREAAEVARSIHRQVLVRDGPGPRS